MSARLALLPLLFCAFNAVAVEAPLLIKTIELEWDAVEKASGYQVRLTPAKGGKALRFLTEIPKIQQDVPVGLYKLQIRSRSEDQDVFGPWSDAIPLEVVEKELTPLKPADNEVLSAINASKFTIDFEWEPVANVKEYTLKVWSDKRKDNPWVFVTKRPGKKLDVPPADIYYWQVLFESATGINYAQSPTTFKFTLMGAKLTAPEIGLQNVTPQNQVLEWQESPGATHYQATLHYRHLDESEWTKVSDIETKNTKWTFEHLKRGAYRLEVRASAHRRTTSDTSTFEFVIKPLEAELKISSQAFQPKNLSPQTKE